MYCSECGCEVNGKFCSNCGTRVQLGEVREVFDWRQSYDFERITHIAEVNQRVTQAKAGAGRDTSSLLLDLIDAVASPMMGGVSSLAIAKASQPLTAKLGFKTGKERREFVTLPPGEVLANLAVTLASIEHSITCVTFGDNHCHIRATLPPDLRAMEVRLSVNIDGAEQGMWITATAEAEGQWYDWGKCQSQLDRLFTGLRAA
ncbi:hypothetical protein CA51_31170 [Rosistilla oblonga]|uniref:zinc ribbon domain-containing protein n=1 Tax=Rosistilla oblonga TaxID=2527990 RepID=UPI00118BBEF1|nr:zinc ribbon domain-containing protein [Rosistilla oblonga]QDV13229.1 hypothetical protein CA51_31170 [Rosistilla oblonga]